jgi:CIC family chloride channel protein
MGVTERLGRVAASTFGVRSQRTLVLAAVTGGITGLAVYAFEWLSREQIFESILTAPLVMQAVALLIGLLLAAAALAWLLGGASPATSDEYIANFHQPERRLAMREAPAKIAAGIATLGSGGALGYEGPSLYIGAAIGTALQRRLPRPFNRDDLNVLMVAGAAAGVAAIFKAPATGAVFALEVPYREDTARRLLLPALIGAAAGYLVFVSLAGTQPLFGVAGTPPFDLKELGGAAALGVVCGLAARIYARLIAWAKRLTAIGHPAVRAVIAAGLLAALLFASHAIFGEGLSTGSGYRTLEWIREPRTAQLIVALLAIRVLATLVTLAGGGVGGLFIPLVVAGALVGDLTSTLLEDTSSLFPVIGVAALLGAGYRTPLAGVMFVAETTGRPGFVVPGVVASVVAQLMMGDASVSPYQEARRAGHLEQRLGLPIAAAIDADARTIPPDASLAEFHQHMLLTRRIEVAVVEDDNTYAGMITAHHLHSIAPTEWQNRSVGSECDTSWPIATLDWSLGDAARVMAEADVGTLPVVDGASYVGVVTTSDLLQLDQIVVDGDRSIEHDR